MVLVVFGSASVGLAQAAEEKTTVEDIKAETRELTRKLSAYGAEQRDEAIQSIETTLEDLDARIEVLEQRIDRNWDQMSDAAREEAQANLRALREQRTKVAKWYDSLKASSANAWDKVKAGFSDAYQDLSEAWQNAEDAFEDEQ